jgi:DNA-binding LytR/AlgR family response regulator
LQQPFSILIIEDEVLIAQDLREILEEVGYEQVYRARDFSQATKILQSEAVDLVLLDINLNQVISGIDIAHHINQHYQIPFIYITSYSDATTLESVKPTKPAGFLLKPYNKTLLLATIEIALFNYVGKTNAADRTNEAAPSSSNSDFIIHEHLLLKENHHYIKIPLSQILWFESEKNYVQVITADKKYLLRGSLKKLIEHLPQHLFAKSHKCFIINLSFVEAFNADYVVIQGQKIPISRTENEEVLDRLKR